MTNTELLMLALSKIGTKDPDYVVQKDEPFGLHILYRGVWFFVVINNDIYEISGCGSLTITLKRNEQFDLNNETSVYQLINYMDALLDNT